MAMSDDLERYYVALGLRPGASPDEIRQAYRNLVKVWHPDRFSDDRLRQNAEEKLKEINEAYNRLRHARPPRPDDSTTTRRADHRERGVSSPHQTAPHRREGPPRRVRKRPDPIRKRVSLARVLGAVLLILAVWYVAESAVPHLREWLAENIYKAAFEAPEAEIGNEPDQQDTGTITAATQPPVQSEFQITLPLSLPTRYFTIGSTRAEVEAIQGAPDRISGDTFHYGTSHVLFHGDRVVSWNNSYPRLKVQLRAASPTTKTHYTVGSTKDEVVAIQGTPDRFTGDSLHYGTSEVLFQGGAVVGWKNNFPKLKVQLLPARPATTDSFTIGSTKDEVLALQGTPDRFTSEAFQYGTSEVLFKNDRVVSWTNSYPRLRVRTHQQR
ncbi:MAG TPA: J domain-containing protein [Methylomirabilota bacterium]|nr:J domain-containing protein [Methylomirabilota bacterium]